MNICFDNYII